MRKTAGLLIECTVVGQENKIGGKSTVQQWKRRTSFFPLWNILFLSSGFEKSLHQLSYNDRVYK